MDPLIQITTIPIEIEMTTKRATLEYVKGRGTAELEISSSGDGGTSITSRSMKVDRFESRNDNDWAQYSGNQFPKNMRFGYQVTGVSARQGELVLNAKVEQEFASQFPPAPSDDAAENGFGGMTAWQPMIPLQTNPAGNMTAPETEFVQQDRPLLDMNDADLQIRLAMDGWDKVKLGIQDLPSQSFKYTPGSIEFTVITQPQTVIEYIGGPIYVPPSSDPNYNKEQLDILA